MTNAGQSPAAAGVGGSWAHLAAAATTVHGTLLKHTGLLGVSGLVFGCAAAADECQQLKFRINATDVR